jgi:phosphate-selective porin
MLSLPSAALAEETDNPAAQTSAPAVAPVAAPADAAAATPAAAPAAAPVAADQAAPLAAIHPTLGPTPTLPAPASPEAAAARQRRVELGGFAKVGFALQQSDPVVEYIGHSNGFEMAGARLEVLARPIENAEAVISVEAALDRPADKTGVQGEKLVSLRDAFIAYEAFPALVVTLGQYKAPFSAEALMSDSDLIFFDRSIVTRGMLPPEGYQADGLSLDRQVGASVSSRRLGLGPVGFRYALGAFNGNGANRLFNDNKSLTPAGRITVDFRELVAVGFAAYQNPRTVGTLPDLAEEKDTGLTADVSVNVAGARLLASYTARNREYLTIEPRPPDDRAWGALAQISWRHEGTGLEPAYRFAVLDPSKLTGFEKVTQHTIGLNWKPSNRPLRVFAAFVVRQEQAERELVNNGLDLGAQLNF